MLNGSELDPVEHPAFGSLLCVRVYDKSSGPFLGRVERMMQREQDLPLSFFVRDCHDDSEGAF